MFTGNTGGGTAPNRYFRPRRELGRPGWPGPACHRCCPPIMLRNNNSQFETQLTSFGLYQRFLSHKFSQIGGYKPAATVPCVGGAPKNGTPTPHAVTVERHGAQLVLCTVVSDASAWDVLCCSGFGGGSSGVDDAADVCAVFESGTGVGGAFRRHHRLRTATNRGSTSDSLRDVRAGPAHRRGR
jgi:hypothetical protein